MFSCFASDPKKQHDRAAILVWDIENVRLPLNMSVASVVAEVKRAFVFAAGFSEHASVCCLTPLSLRAMAKLSPGFVHEAVPLMDIRLASDSRAKLGADFVLRRELGTFMDRFASSASSCRIVLLTGDADFLEPVQRALRLGFDVLLVHFGRSSSRLLVGQRYASPPVEWERFLTDANGGTAPYMPYVDAVVVEKKKVAEAKATKAAIEADAAAARRANKATAKCARDAAKCARSEVREVAMRSCRDLHARAWAQCVGASALALVLQPRT